MSKEGLKLYCHQLTYLLKLQNIIRKLYHIQGDVWGLSPYGTMSKHAKIGCDKVQLT